MFLQNLFCCGSCSVGQDAFQGLGSNSQTEAATNANKITNKIQLYTAIVRIGEIFKINKSDRFPSLEVSIEMENDKIKPDAQFVYLHDIRNDLEEIQEENKYCIERLEWAENIGKTYILLDFDKTQKYKIYYMKKVMDNKKGKQKGANTLGGAIQPEKRKAILRYEILGQSPAFSVQASINNRDINENSYFDTNNQNSISSISPPLQEEIIRRKKPNGQANSMQISDQQQFDALNESEYDHQYANNNDYGSLNGIRKKQEDNERGKLTDQKQTDHEGNRVLQNYNPMTRTYFKCSVYSPSNRLFTVDEVNSNFSGNDQLSQNNLSQYQRHPNHLNVASYQGSFREDLKSDCKLKTSNSQGSLHGTVTPMIINSESQSEITSGQCISDLNSVEMTTSEKKQYFSKKSSLSGRGSPFSISNQVNSHNEELHPRKYELESGDKKDKENFVTSSRQSVPQKSLSTANTTSSASTANQSQNIHWFLKRNNSYNSNKSSMVSTTSQKKPASDANFMNYYNEVATQFKEKDKKKNKIPFNYDSRAPVPQMNKFSQKTSNAPIQTLSSKNKKPSLKKFE